MTKSFADNYSKGKWFFSELVEVLLGWRVLGGKGKKYIIWRWRKIFDQQKNFIEIYSKLKHFNIDGNDIKEYQYGNNAKWVIVEW